MSEGQNANQDAPAGQNTNQDASAPGVRNSITDGDNTFADQNTHYRNDELDEYGRRKDREAPDQRGTSVLLGFRRKVFALAILQCGAVMVLAWAIANIPLVDDLDIAYTTENLMRDGIIIAVTWISALIALVVLSAMRHTYPKNYAAMAVFTIFISVAIAVLAGPNIHLGMGIILMGFVLTALFTSFPCGGKVIEVFPVSFGVMIVTNILTLVWHFTFNTFIGLFWVVLLMIMNTVAICWAGYQMDFLSSRLKVDEFLLPLILMWAELMVAMFIMMSIEALTSNVGECGDSCYMWGHTTWHCDCWIYADGRHGSDQYRRPRQPEQQAPVQEQMEGGTAADTAPAPPPPADTTPAPQTVGAPAEAAPSAV